MASTWSGPGRASNPVDDSGGPAAVSEPLEGSRALIGRVRSGMVQPHVVAMGPLILDVLEELAVPGALRRADIAPEQAEFRQLLPGKVGVDVGQPQDVEHVLARSEERRVGRDGDAQGAGA